MNVNTHWELKSYVSRKALRVKNEALRVQNLLGDTACRWFCCFISRSTSLRCCSNLLGDTACRWFCCFIRKASTGDTRNPGIQHSATSIP